MGGLGSFGVGCDAEPWLSGYVNGDMESTHGVSRRNVLVDSSLAEQVLYLRCRPNCVELPALRSGGCWGEVTNQKRPCNRSIMQRLRQFHFGQSLSSAELKESRIEKTFNRGCNWK